MSLHTAFKLGEALKVSMFWLAGLEDAPEAYSPAGAAGAIVFAEYDLSEP